VTVLENLLSPAVPDSKILYHYTGQDGLLGIIKEKKFRVSSILHLNDAAEFNYTIELARQHLSSRLRHERGPCNTFYGTALDGLGFFGKFALFVGSFTQNGDSLSQWRAYAQGGIGFSLGFECEQLRPLAEAQGFRLLRCSYDKVEHSQAIDDLVNDAGQRLNPRDGNDVGLAVQYFYDELVNVATVLKHPSFAEEREWRLISSPVLLDLRPPALFRSGKSMVVPYREFDLVGVDGRMRLADLCIGPTPHTELSRLSVEHLLVASGVENVSVRGSAVPYRSW